MLNYSTFVFHLERLTGATNNANQIKVALLSPLRRFLLRASSSLNLFLKIVFFLASLFLGKEIKSGVSFYLTLLLSHTVLNCGSIEQMIF